VTDKQMAFAQAYVSDPELNAARAYLSVYGNCKSPSSAATCSSRLLKNVDVRVYVDEMLDEIRSKKVATAQEVQERLTAIMRGEVETEIPIFVDKGVQEMENVGTPIKEVVKAAELLGRAHGMFTDNINVVETPIINDDI